MRALIPLAILAAASGCAQVRNHQGYLADATLTSAITPGVDNRASVERTLGRPSFIGQFDANDWYYLSRNTRQLAFALPRPTEQTLLHVRFDAAGNVASVRDLGLTQVARINPVGDKTPTLGRNRGFFEDLFGNIGQVGAVSPTGGTTDNPGGN